MIRNTIRAYRYLKKQGLDLSVASEHDIIDFLAEWRAQGVPRKKINGYIKRINRYLMFWGTEFRVKPYREIKSHRPIIILSDDEVRRILSVRWTRPDVDLRNRAMINLLFATGTGEPKLLRLLLQQQLEEVDGEGKTW